MRNIKLHIFKHGWFYIALFLGIVLRAIFLYKQGLSHDELSAWNRIGAFNFRETLELGVKPDMHPAFMQLLLQYWTNIFGDSELVLRIPSTIFGLAGIVMTYILGNRFVSKNTGFWATFPLLLFIFPIIHTTLARPYAPGFFFCIFYIFGVFILKQSTHKTQQVIAATIITLSGTLALYTHYYAGLICGICGIFALFFVGKKRLQVLFFSGFITAVLFLPHWPITQEQLSRGGLGWLGKPEIDWLADFFVLFFNNSIFIALFIGFIVLSLIYKFGFKLSNAGRFLLLLFFGVYLISHILSLVYTPILREPGMLFIVTFLFLALADGLKTIQFKYSNLVKGLILFTAFGTSLLFGKIKETVHFEPFRELTELVKKYDDQLGENNILKFCNVTNINYLNYYAQKNGAHLRFKMTLIEDAHEIHEMARIIQESDKPYLMLARTNRAQNVIQYEIIRHYYPEILVHYEFTNANFSIWKKNNKYKRKYGKTIRFDHNPSLSENWNSDTTSVEFIGNIRIKAKVLNHPNTYILVKSKGWIGDACSELNFITVLVQNGAIVLEEEQPLLYQAWDQLKMHPITGEREFFTAFTLPKKIKNNDEVHIYFWNRTFAKVVIHKPIVYVVQANH